MFTLSDQDITNALLDGGGILSIAARHLSEQLGRPVTREMVAQRVENSRVLTAVRQIAERQAWDRSFANAKQRRKEQRSASMKASWAERKARATAGSDTVPGDPNDLEHVDVLDAPNVRARTRSSRDITPATVQAARDQRLCGAKTRKGFPCVRRVVPGRNRCPNHGGLTTGPKTVEGKARIAAAARARWARYRQERHA